MSYNVAKSLLSNKVPAQNPDPMRLPELDAVLADINRIILGKERPIRLASPACWRAAIC
jgi:hypothetical protein